MYTRVQYVKVFVYIVACKHVILTIQTDFNYILLYIKTLLHTMLLNANKKKPSLNPIQAHGITKIEVLLLISSFLNHESKVRKQRQIWEMVTLPRSLLSLLRLKSILCMCACLWRWLWKSTLNKSSLLDGGGGRGSLGRICGKYVALTRWLLVTFAA